MFEYSVKKDGISQSLLGNYQQCPRRFYIATREHLSQPDSFSLALGSCGHEALAQMHDGKKFNLKTIFAARQVDNVQWRELIAGYLSEIIPAYVAVHGAEKGIESEQPFDVRLYAYRLRGKRDGLSLNKTQGVWLRETKFKSMISEDNIDKVLRLDHQILFYAVATELETGKLVRGVIYDVVRYPSGMEKKTPVEIVERLKKDVARDPGYWFKRWPIELDQSVIAEYKTGLVQKLGEIESRMHWWRAESSCCAPWPCPFMDYCAAGDKTGLIEKELFSEI